MDIEKLDADQFARLVAAVGRLFGALRENGTFDGASAAGMTDDEANAFGARLIADALPSLLETNSDTVYGLLAALKGQTLKEYKDSFDVRRCIADVKDAASLVADGGLTDFLPR